MCDACDDTIILSPLEQYWTKLITTNKTWFGPWLFQSSTCSINPYVLGLSQTPCAKIINKKKKVVEEDIFALFSWSCPWILVKSQTSLVSLIAVLTLILLCILLLFYKFVNWSLHSQPLWCHITVLWLVHNNSSCKHFLQCWLAWAKTFQIEAEFSTMH